VGGHRGWWAVRPRRGGCIHGRSKGHRASGQDGRHIQHTCATAGAAVGRQRFRSCSRNYDDNEVSADQKYKGKRLSVSGSVQSIDKDAFDNIVVKLRTSNEFMAVHASLEDKHE
jgi:hypothetical protein